MQDLKLENTGIYIDGDPVARLDALQLPENKIIITDENIAAIYKDLTADAIIIPAGDSTKTLSTIYNIYDEMLQRSIDRDSFVIGFGGGVVTDIAGFVASTYMRGMRFGFLPTSLLAMIDASIGGKNGVNFKHYKNIIGTINQAEFVIVNPGFLATLPFDEYKSGMAEAIKHFLINDKKAFYNFAQNNTSYLNPSELSADFLKKQIEIKISIVKKDLNEHGERRKLNFGHSFGHAIEKISGIKHGYAVSTGMVIAAEVSRQLGYLSQNDVDDIKNVLADTGLPVKTDIPNSELIETIYKDKKKSGEDIYFVALEEIGKAKIIKMKISELAKLVD